MGKYCWRAVKLLFNPVAGDLLIIFAAVVIYFAASCSWSCGLPAYCTNHVKNTFFGGIVEILFVANVV